MCEPFDGNKIHECNAAELDAGDRFRTPDGGEYIVINRLDTKQAMPPVMTVNIRTGVVTEFPPTTKLGRDRAGRLYASRYLNPQVLEVEEEVTPDMTESHNDAGH